MNHTTVNKPSTALAKHKKSNTTIVKRANSKEKTAGQKTSADISHISNPTSPKNNTAKTLKALNSFVQNYFNKKTQQLIINHENFNIPSKFQALTQLLSQSNFEETPLKTLGLWSCNLPTQKMAALMSLIRGGKCGAVEISDCPKELKKEAVKAICEVFLY